MMTERMFKMAMKRIPKGEYNASDVYELYKLAHSKRYQDVSKYENNMRYLNFCMMFESMKYGIEAMFHGKIRYIGTNDCDTLVIE